MRICKNCGQNNKLPEPKFSNESWTWENKKDRPAGGMHYCRICRTAKKRAAWNNFYINKQLRCVVSRSITQKLKSRGGSKNGSILTALPYTIEDLKKHLESKFTLGMTWDNYGDWHVDHIRPDNSFKYDKMSDDQFLASWSLNNLQPLWAMDNFCKSKKVI